MSTRVMAACWPLQMPASAKAVLISLADQANDDGVCWPSIGTVAQRTCLSERTVRSAIGWLQDGGFLARDMQSGRTTKYTLTPANVAPLQHLHPCKSRTPTPAAFAPPPANAAPPLYITVIEPSVEPSKKRTRERSHVDCPADVPAQVWSDWLRVRTAKRAGGVTLTALAGVQREAQAAGLTLAQALAVCCERSWAGFRADWYANTRPQPRASPADVRDAEMARFMGQLTGGLAGRRTEDPDGPELQRIA